MWFWSMLESHFSVMFLPFFQNMSHQDNFYEEQEVDFQGWGAYKGAKKAIILRNKHTGVCPIPIQANDGRR